MGCNNLITSNSGSKQLERTRYFSRQLITADDLTQDQSYHREKLRLHNRLLHGWGIVCGLEVIAPKSGAPLNVTICPGYALSPQGDEIYVPTEIQFDLEQCIVGQSAPCHSPCAPVVPGAVKPMEPFYIAIKYVECMSHPVQVPPVGCGCDETACEYSRIRDSYEVNCLGADKLPKTYFEMPSKEDIESNFKNKVFPCPACVEFPWVVLALVTPKDKSGTIEYRLDFSKRRILLSTSSLQIIIGK